MNKDLSSMTVCDIVRLYFQISIKKHVLTAVGIAFKDTNPKHK